MLTLFKDGMFSVWLIIVYIRVHFAGRKIAITFLILVQFQNFKDRWTRNARALPLVFLERYDARARI